MTKIKGIQTTTSYVYDKVRDWIDNSGLVHKHFIDERTLIEMVFKCIRHSKRVSRKLRNKELRGKS